MWQCCSRLRDKVSAYIGIGYSDTMATMRKPNNNAQVGGTAAYRCECEEKIVFSKG